MRTYNEELKTKLSKEIQDIEMEMYAIDKEIKSVVNELNNDKNNEELRNKYNDLMKRYYKLETMSFEKCDKYDTL